MLELVGHPVAVNPDAQLRRLAASRRWRIRAFRREQPAIRLSTGIEFWA